MSQFFRMFGPTLVMLIPFIAIKVFVALFQVLGFGDK